ncbi:MAG: hypothetical protein K2X09_04990, partial [Rickettsiales bacterium]|nr:hypothetical protein [Rickettsiales bacterium]
MVTSYTHDKKYKSGEKVSLAGVPAAKISEIARNYVYTNMDKIGATEENFKAALGIDSRLTGTTLGERLASL